MVYAHGVDFFQFLMAISYPLEKIISRRRCKKGLSFPFPSFNQLVEDVRLTFTTDFPSGADVINIEGIKIVTFYIRSVG